MKANVHEIADCFRKAYPTAKLLYPGKEDFTSANRQELFLIFENNSWDCIILTHDQFFKIPQFEQTMLEICVQELQDVERSLVVLNASGMADCSKRLQKGLEKRQKNLEANLEAWKKGLARKRMIALIFTLWILTISLSICAIIRTFLLSPFYILYCLK